MKGENIAVVKLNNALQDAVKSLGIEDTQEISIESDYLPINHDLGNIYYNSNGFEAISPNRSYSYRKWVEDVMKLAEDISEDEKNHWIEVNDLVDDSQIRGTASRFNFKVNTDYSADNLLMLSEE